MFLFFYVRSKGMMRLGHEPRLNARITGSFDRVRPDRYFRRDVARVLARRWRAHGDEPFLQGSARQRAYDCLSMVSFWVLGTPLQFTTTRTISRLLVCESAASGRTYGPCFLQTITALKVENEAIGRVIVDDY
jgi:hypothetical protein